MKIALVATRAELASAIDRSLAGEDEGRTGVLVLAPELLREWTR